MTSSALWTSSTPTRSGFRGKDQRPRPQLRRHRRERLKGILLPPARGLAPSVAAVLRQVMVQAYLPLGASLLRAWWCLDRVLIAYCDDGVWMVRLGCCFRLWSDRFAPLAH